MKDLLGFPLRDGWEMCCQKKDVESTKKRLSIIAGLNGTDKFGSCQTGSPYFTGDIYFTVGGKKLRFLIPNGIELQTTEGPKFDVFVLPNGMRKVVYTHTYRVLG